MQLPFSDSVLLLLSPLLALVIGLYAVKKVIFITQKRKIYDIPDNIRKIHGEQIPSLGGIGIFIGFVAVASLFAGTIVPGWNFLIISSSILFFTGIYDDIMNMRPEKKLAAQFIAAFVGVYFTGLEIHSFQGLFGIEEVPYWAGVAITSFLCAFFINVFNFIDGIDGLACLLTIVSVGIAAPLLWFTGNHGGAVAALALAGATGGLLYYNFEPAKIYMGDTGSMMAGFWVWSFMAMLVKTTNHIPYPLETYITPSDAMKLTLAVLLFPVFDALRVFFVRASKGISPLKADRRHLHYYLLDKGLNHARATAFIVMVHLVTIVGAWYFRFLEWWLFVPFITIPSLVATKWASASPKKS